MKVMDGFAATIFSLDILYKKKTVMKN